MYYFYAFYFLDQLKNILSCYCSISPQIQKLTCELSVHFQIQKRANGTPPVFHTPAVYIPKSKCKLVVSTDWQIPSTMYFFFFNFLCFDHYLFRLHKLAHVVIIFLRLLIVDTNIVQHCKLVIKLETCNYFKVCSLTSLACWYSFVKKIYLGIIEWLRLLSFASIRYQNYLSELLPARYTRNK